MIARIDNSTGLVFENDDGIRIPGKVICVVGYRHKGGIWWTLWINLVRLIRTQKLKIRLKPRCTISHLEGPNFANMLTCCGGARLLFVHNKVSDSYQRRTPRNRLKLALCKILYKKADSIIAVSQGIADDLVNIAGLAPSKIQVQDNPVDVNSIRIASKQDTTSLGIVGQYSYIVSVASLTEQKNHLQMLQVFREYLLSSEKNREVKLVLLGDGPLREDLHRSCADLGLNSWAEQTPVVQNSEAHVFFLGFQRNPYPIVARAKALIMTSFWEGLPVSLLEAMSLGIPSVVSDSSTAIRELWRSKTCSAELDLKSGKSIETPYGVLMPPTSSQRIDMQAWITSINKVVSCKPPEQLSYRKRCQERAMDYDIERAAASWRTIVDDLG
tara:strand:+ start:176 stop:1330 length:1155 start_codon:yes stop_codon:yes gene_type:complete